MQTSLAPAPDLLTVVREFLERDIVRDPNLGDEKRFNLRVAINLLATAERELRLGPAANAAEADRLTAFVGAEGTTAEKNRRLARAIHDGAIPIDDRQLLDHLFRTMVDSLRINNPKWIDSSRLDPSGS